MLHVRAGWFGRCPCCHHTCLHCRGAHVCVRAALIKLLIPFCTPSLVYHKVTEPMMTLWLLGKLVKKVELVKGITASFLQESTVWMGQWKCMATLST